MQSRIRISIAVGLLVLASAAAAGRAARSEGEEGAAPGSDSGRYEFTSDWHSHAIPRWEKALAEYRGRPELRYLEIGIFQGRSFFWMLENIATHPSSRLIGIDIDLEHIQKNLAASGAAERIELHEGRSDRVLRTLSGPFDIIYIDGSHRGDDVLADAVLAFSQLRDGGTLIFDDYRWRTKKEATSSLILPSELRPFESINFFVTTNRDRIEIVDSAFQLIVRRRAPLCEGFDNRFCSPVGRYVYDWDRRAVVDPRTREDVAMTGEELAMVETLIRSIPPGQVRVTIPRRLRDSDVARSLEGKLGLPPPPPRPNR